MDKFSSKVHRVHMELGGKLFNSLRIETQFLERLQSVSDVDGAAHTQKDDVESNGGSLENIAKVFVLFLCGVQLVLKGLVSSQYLISTRWMSRRVLLRSLGRCCLGSVAVLVAGGAAEVLPVSLNCPLPLQRTHLPALVCCICVFAAMGVTSTKSGRLEVNLFIWEAGWEGPFGNNYTFSCSRNMEVLHGHPFIAAYILGDYACS
jgi:hypothetical protein